MSAQPTSTPSSDLRSNFTAALADNTPDMSDSADADSVLSSPESTGSVGFIEMSDLMLPASDLECELFGVPQDSGATVVSAASCDEVSSSSISGAPASPRPKSSSSPAGGSERRHSLPSTLMLSGGGESPLGDSVTQPVPEFLCHLFSMLRDPSYADLISWVVPAADEPDHLGGGVGGVGKVVVHRPEALQDEGVLGRYYRHSKYASFQRQLNYFGFKKRLHGGKKGKLDPCSYVHGGLTDDVGSLFSLKRRPPSKKRASEDVDCSAEEGPSSSAHYEPGAARPKKRRAAAVEKKPKKKAGKKRNRKDKKPRVGGKQQVAVSAVPHQVLAEEYGPPSTRSSPVVESNRLQARPSAAATTQTHAQQPGQSTPAAAQPAAPAPAAQLTLLELLSTTLPPSEILFDDSRGVESTDDDGIPAWVTDDGKYHYHNVDSSLVDLAMLY